MRATSPQPNLIVVMGISGSGKTTLGRQLAKSLGIDFVEADDFHSQQAKERMANGEPLTDQWREPWIKSICSHLMVVLHYGGESRVLACSGLRKAHRQSFRELGYKTFFLYLDGSPKVIWERLRARKNHFMPANLLQTQIDAMECPRGEPDVYPLDLNKDLSELVEDSLEIMRAITPSDFIGA